MENRKRENILVMDAGTDSIKLMMVGMYEKPLKVPAVLARKRHNRKIQLEVVSFQKTKFGEDAYLWSRMKMMKNEKNVKTDRYFNEKENKNKNNNSKNVEDEDDDNDNDNDNDNDDDNDDNDDDDEIELIYPHMRHPLNYKKNAMYAHKQNSDDQKMLWNFVVQTLPELRERNTEEKNEKHETEFDAKKRMIRKEQNTQNRPSFSSSSSSSFSSVSSSSFDSSSCSFSSSISSVSSSSFDSSSSSFSSSLSFDNNYEGEVSVCIVQPPPILRTKNYDKEMFSWIFENEKFDSALILPDCKAALYFFQLSTGLIMDVGELYSRSVCILENEIDVHSYKHIPLAAHAVTSYLERIIGCRYPQKYVDRFQIQHIQQKTSFVSDSFQKDLWVNSRCRCLHTYSFPNGGSIDLGADAFMCLEILFNPSVVLGDFEHESIASMIVESVCSSSIDYRKRLLQNVILTGSITDTFNFSNRLQQEIEKSWLSSFTCGNISAHVQQNSDAIILGAAQYAMNNKNISKLWLSRKEYEDEGCERFLYEKKNNILF